MIVENELRKWLADTCWPLLDVQWVEPGRYGSTQGAADAIVRDGVMDVALELKIWERKRRGIKCVMRPVQRQWHHKMMRRGNKCAVLFNVKDTDEIYLLRGDRVPWRDYADDQYSRCVDGQLRLTVVQDDFQQLLFNNDDRYHFWLF